jgi:hypothetical protein
MKKYLDDSKVDLEQDDLVHKGISNVSDTASDHAILSEFSKAEERSIIHRVDRRLVVTVGFMYCISLMDRTNLSAANIAGFVSMSRLLQSANESNKHVTGSWSR